MGTKIKFDIVLYMYAIFVSMLLISPPILAKNNSDSEIVAKIFHLTGAKIAKVQVNGWAKINKSGLAQESPAEYLKNRVQRLSELGFAGSVKREYDGQSPTLVTEGTIEPGISVRVVLTNTFSNKAGRRVMYLTASVTTQNGSIRLADLDKYLMLIIPEKDNHRSVVLAGSLPGYTSPPVVNEIVHKTVLFTGAQNVETMVNGHLVSITGHVPNVRTRLTLGEKSVNINIAFRYNSIDNRTYVYTGSPIITNEY